MNQNCILNKEHNMVLTEGSNSIVYLSPSRHSYRLNLTAYNTQIVSFGTNNYFNGKLNLVSSEQTNITVGNDCLFSFGI